MGKKQRTSTTSITIDVMSGDAPTVQLFVESKNSNQQDRDKKEKRDERRW